MCNTWKRPAVALRLGLSVAILFLAAACATTATPTPSITPGTEVTVPEGSTTTEPATPTATTIPTAMPTATTTPTPTPKTPSEKTKKIPATVNGRAYPSGPLQLRDGTDGDDQAMPIMDKGQLKYPNLGSRLDGLVASVEAGETTAEQAAADTPVHSGESVAVTIYLSSYADELIAFLEQNGSSPRNAGEDYVEAYVPVTLLGPLSERPGVLRIREIVPPQPAQGA